MVEGPNSVIICDSASITIYLFFRKKKRKKKATAGWYYYYFQRMDKNKYYLRICWNKNLKSWGIFDNKVRNFGEKGWKKMME